MKKIITSLFIILSIFLLAGCNKKEEQVKENKEEIVIKNQEEANSMTVTINEKEYPIELEENETVKKLLELLPLDLTMQELNGNEKYIYLEESLPTNASIPDRINQGDVMLFGDNCLVIFYESFDTTYSYTKIGHINNLPNIGNGNINVQLKK